MLEKMCEPLTNAVRNALTKGFLLFMQDVIRMMKGETIPIDEIRQAMGQPAIGGPKPPARKTRKEK